MAKPQRYRSNSKYNQPKYDHRVGEVVYFHAQPFKSKDEKSFICKGVVLRQPNQDGNVYKVAIVAVNPHSVLHGELPDLAKILLGKKIPRSANQLMETLSSGVLSAVYAQTAWLEISQYEEKMLRQLIGKADGQRR